MFTVQQYRAEAIKYAKLVRTANGPNEVREFERLERSFTELADNAQWVTDNRGKNGAVDGAPQPQRSRQIQQQNYLPALKAPTNR